MQDSQRYFSIRILKQKKYERKMGIHLYIKKGRRHKRNNDKGKDKAFTNQKIKENFFLFSTRKIF